MQVVKCSLLYAVGAEQEACRLSALVMLSGSYKSSEGAQEDANYVQAMVHRLEGDWVEEGKTPESRPGWESALEAFGRIPKHLLFPKVLEEARRCAGRNSLLVAHLKEHEENGGWDAKAFVEFCKEAHATKQEDALMFCGRIMNAEWQLLLDHVLAKVTI